MADSGGAVLDVDPHVKETSILGVLEFALGAGQDVKWHAAESIPVAFPISSSRGRYEHDGRPHASTDMVMVFWRSVDL